jgi:hypothetical protein
MTSLRPSEFRAKFANRPDDLSLEVLRTTDEDGGSAEVYLVDKSLEALSPSTGINDGTRILLLSVTPDLATIWPITIRPGTDKHLRPKYGQLECIFITRYVARPYELPENQDDVVELLDSLPDGFAKNFRFGLGVLWEYRFICEAVASIPDITALWIHGKDGDAIINPPFYVLGLDRFRALRKDIAKISSRYQRESLGDKRLLVYQRLLHAADRTRFPGKAKNLKADSITDLVGVAGKYKANLSKSDRRSVLKLTTEHIEELSKTEAHTLLKLKSDIEVVTLRNLIERFQANLTSSHVESYWQSFFSKNPFVLSLAFSLPMFLLQGNPYVGGARLDRSGAKFSDFLLQTASTGNLALIEIKRPDTAILSKEPYRNDVYGLHADMSGTLSQVLDQRFRLHKELLNLKEESGLHDIHAYAIRCVVIAGRTPTKQHEKKSLELLRHSIFDVAIVTFDELLGRLIAVYRALAPETGGSVTAFDDVPF